MKLEGLKVMYKVKGQCTTDTISAAGPWLKYKGHLPNISENTLIGAVNAETGETNVAYDEDGTQSSIPDLAKKWKSKGQQWLVVAEDNYGEGSAREHAALQPRYLGGRIILAKSFARIHQTNLKKQGVLPLTFTRDEDYDRVRGDDRVDVLCSGIKAGAPLTMRVHPNDGGAFELELQHSLNETQIEWFKAGSALNAMARGSATTASVEA